MGVENCGSSFDLSERDAMTSQKYDLSERADRNAVLRHIAVNKPVMVTMGPPCTMFSLLQNLNPNRWTSEWRGKLREAVDFVNFCCVVMRMQHRGGRYFMLGQPLTSKAWFLKEVAQIARLPGVEMCVVDMCQYGLES